MERIDNNSLKLRKAKFKVEELKNFYKHVVTYILVNLFLAFAWSFSFKIFGNFIVSNQFNGGDNTYIPIWFSINKFG